MVLNSGNGNVGLHICIGEMPLNGLTITITGKLNIKLIIPGPCLTFLIPRERFHDETYSYTRKRVWRRIVGIGARYAVGRIACVTFYKMTGSEAIGETHRPSAYYNPANRNSGRLSKESATTPQTSRATV